MRVVLCGLEGEHEMPASWRCVAWKARGGYGSQRAAGDNDNRHRERLWLSPHCLDATRQPSLFGGGS
jgi:DNA adenine methylase